MRNTRAVAVFVAGLVTVLSAARGEIQDVKVPSAAMHRDIPATVTLPADYKPGAAPRPVLYLLHGAGDNERAWVDRTPVQEMSDRYGVIVVTPAVGLSWYFDSPEDTNSQFETFVASELVKYVDAHYSTVTSRWGRALAGNSMGGQGAMFLALRHKEAFCAAAPMSGCMDIRASDPQVGSFAENWGLKKYLGPIQKFRSRWDELAVINLVDTLKDGELALSIDCGDGDFFRTVNRQLHEKLTAHGIAHEYAEFPGAHNWNYWKLALPRQMAFLDRQFARGLAAAPVQQGGTQSRHAAKCEAVAKERFDLLMIGDSITHTLDNFGGKYTGLTNVWNRHYAPRHAINLAYSGGRTENILWNLDHGELEGQTPKLAVLLIGTNDADDRHFPVVHTAEQIRTGTQAIIGTILRRSPATKILILRLFPRGGDAEKGVGGGIFHSSPACIETVRRAGELTKTLADDKRVFWLDVNQVFLRPDGTINTDLMPDLLHPNEAGAEAWARAIEPTISRLMGDLPAQGQGTP